MQEASKAGITEGREHVHVIRENPLTLRICCEGRTVEGITSERKQDVRLTYRTQMQHQEVQ